MSNSQVSIRKATDDDIAQIVAWLKEELHAQVQDSVAEAAIPIFTGPGYNGETLVLVDADGTTVLAFASYQANQIELFSVRGEYQEQGHGSGLAKCVIDKMRTTGWPRVWLECDPPSSGPFWQSLCFTQIPERPGIWMELDLTLNP